MMAPKKGPARKTSVTPTTDSATNSVTPSPPMAASPPPMTLMGRPKQLSQTVQLVLLPVIAMATSAVLYTAVDSLSFVDLQQLSSVAREPELWRQVVPIVTRIIILYAQWALGFDAVNAFAVTLHIRLPFYFLLYLFYNISLQTVAASAVIDAASCAVAFLALNRRRPIDYTSRAAAKSIEAHALYNVTNVLVLTSLATAGFAVSLFGASMISWFRLCIILNFDVPSVERLNFLQLPGFLALSLPLGWSLREYLFGPPTSVDSKSSGPRRLQTSFVKRIVFLSTLSFVETFARTFTAIEGASLVGAAMWACFWFNLVWIVTLPLILAGSAAQPENELLAVGYEDELKTVVVPERKSRFRRSSAKSVS